MYYHNGCKGFSWSVHACMCAFVCFNSGRKGTVTKNNKCLWNQLKHSSGTILLNTNIPHWNLQCLTCEHLVAYILTCKRIYLCTIVRRHSFFTNPLMNPSLSATLNTQHLIPYSCRTLKQSSIFLNIICNTPPHLNHMATRGGSGGIELRSSGILVVHTMY